MAFSLGSVLASQNLARPLSLSAHRAGISKYINYINSHNVYFSVL